jgi:hypothetical protein
MQKVIEAMLAANAAKEKHMRETLSPTQYRTVDSASTALERMDEDDLYDMLYNMPHTVLNITAVAGDDGSGAYSNAYLDLFEKATGFVHYYNCPDCHVVYLHPDTGRIVGMCNYQDYKCFVYTN